AGRAGERRPPAGGGRAGQVRRRRRPGCDRRRGPGGAGRPARRHGVLRAGRRRRALRGRRHPVAWSARDGAAVRDDLAPEPAAHEAAVDGMTEPEVGRAFVAVVPPDDVLDAVGAVAASIDVPSTARRTSRPQWHLTLQFLGNKVDFAAVAGALEPLAVRGAPVQLGAAGAFPTERRGRVLWLGVREGNAPLLPLGAAGGPLPPPRLRTPAAR